MTFPILPRHLSFKDKDGVEHRIGEAEILARPEPIVILGEAGMGKTTLLSELSKAPGTRLVQARRLASAIDPRPLIGNAETLIIDALDEAPGARDGDAVDRVLARLDMLGHPRFVLACREADWRSITGLAAIADAYGRTPLELRLLPFEAADATRLLASSFGEARAAEIIAHFEERGLGDLFGNPQTLNLIETAAGAGALPETRAAIFETAVDVIWCEHSPTKQDSALARLGREAVLDAAGAAFAMQILAGKEALARGSAAVARPDDLPIAEVDEAVLVDILDSRLFKPLGDERWTHVHRSIGEFLGARWLARRADTARKRRRLHTLFLRQGLVPASLRGLHAWLARSPALAPPVIAHDPMGVIEYGDADALTEQQAAALLDALVALEQRDPRFRGWGRFRANALAGPALRPRVSALIAARDTGFAVRMLLLQVIGASSTIEAFTAVLREILLDDGCYFAARSHAGEALAKLPPGAIDWPATLETLRREAREDSLRLAIDLLSDVGVDRFGDEQIVALIAARAGLTICAVPRERGNSFASPFHELTRNLPPARLEGVLDELSLLVRALLNRKDDYLDRADITDMIFSLAARRVQFPDVDPLRLWNWLSPFEDLTGYHRSALDDLSAWFREHPEARRTIQRHVLLERPDKPDLWRSHWHLERVVPGLAPDESDIVALLPLFGAPARPTAAEIERWQIFVQLVPHNAERGAAVRAAARTFAGNRKRLLNWLDKLAVPRIPSWEVRDAKRREKRQRDREKRWQEHRADYAKHVDALRGGVFGYVHPPAQAYLKLFQDLGDDLPAPERVAEWLGQELREAALTGFEAFLNQTPPKPDATEIAQSHAESRRWNAEHIIIAALAERQRTGLGFADLPTERLVAGALILRQSRLDDHAGLDGLAEGLEAALRERPGAWEGYWRLQIETQFKQRRTHIDGLYDLMRSPAEAELASTLAREWLNAYLDIADEPETVLIDRLIGAGDHEGLAGLAASRCELALSDERRRNWQAVDFLVDFEGARTRLAGIGAREPAMLWHLRRRLGHERGEDSTQPWLSPSQLAWIVSEFRSHWPQMHRPSGSSSGDTNVWDASEFISRTVSRLGEQTSDDAVRALSELKAAAPDGYSDVIAVVSAEQAQKRAEEEFAPIAPPALSAVLTDAPPATTADLRAVLLEEFEALKRRLAGNDTDSWTQFWDNGQPMRENPGRDRVIDLLGPNLPFGITAAPEVDMPSGARADIGFTYGDLRLPVEIKRHWHRDLWHASDSQLDRLYGRDHRAAGEGIFLVLWFGADAGPKMPAPPGTMERPENAVELEAALAATSDAVQRERVTVIVLDVAKRSA